MQEKLKSTSPLVSVLIPIYNTAPYLRECLDSIVGQTYRNLQIILVDDGSTDESPQICKEYAAKDARIEYHHISHTGIAAARNYLVAKAYGEYSIFIDSDDWIATEAIEELVTLIVRNKLDILIFGIINVGHDLEALYLELNKQQAIERFVRDSKIQSGLWSKLVCTKFYRIFPFDSSIECCEDVLMTWRLISSCDRIGIVSNKYYYYRNTPGSTINNPFSKNKQLLYLAWDIIAKECTIEYPYLHEHARQHQAHAYVWALYEAIRANNPHDNNIKYLQREIRTMFPIILLNTNNTLKYISFAFFTAYFYSIVNILVRPWRMRLQALR